MRDFHYLRGVEEKWEMCPDIAWFCLSVHCYSSPLYGEGLLNICACVCVLLGRGGHVCSDCFFPQSFTPVNTISSFELRTFVCVHKCNVHTLMCRDAPNQKSGAGWRALNALHLRLACQWVLTDVLVHVGFDWDDQWSSLTACVSVIYRGVNRGSGLCDVRCDCRASSLWGEEADSVSDVWGWSLRQNP